jgi:DNA-binding response OmpR family regulator
VLIVDDDPDIREALGLYVRAAAPDAEIETTSEGRQAIRSVRRRVPDLLLLDLDLPDINGIEVCMLLRGMQLGDACMIVSISGRATKADVELLQMLGVQSLDKGPTLMAELVALVQRVRPGR